MATMESPPVVESVYDNLTRVDGDGRRLPEAEEVELARELSDVDAVGRLLWRAYHGYTRVYTEDPHAVFDAVAEFDADAEMWVDHHDPNGSTQIGIEL